MFGTWVACWYNLGNTAIQYNNPLTALAKAAIWRKTLSVQQCYLLIYSYIIVLLYSLGRIHPIPTCQTLITLITQIIESFLSSEQITLTLSVQRPYLLTYSYDIVLLYSLGCIQTLPTCQTLNTLITLITESSMSFPKLTLALAALNCHPPLQS